MANKQLEEIKVNLKSVFPQLKNLTTLSMLGDGWGSVAVQGNNNIVFRIAKNAIIQKLHKRQVRILPIIAKKMRSLQIPIPEHYSESSQEFPFGVMGYEKIEGMLFNPAQIAEDKLSRLAYQIAEMLLKFHTIKVTDELRSAGLPQTDYSRETLQNTWGRASVWLKNNLSQKEFDTAQKRWREIIQFFKTKPQENILVHGDPWYGNIILDSKLCLRGIVDFDKVSIGDRAIDFVVQEYVSKEFMNTVVCEYRKLGDLLGDDFEMRIQFLKQIKAIEDLNYCININYFYPNIQKKLHDSFLYD